MESNFRSGANNSNYDVLKLEGKASDFFVQICTET